MGSDTVAVVGCGSAKRDEPAPARDLYTSTYFQKKMQAGEKVGDVIIASAKHGAIDPETVIDPYDVEITDLDDEEIAAWADDIVDAVADYETVVFFAGEDYRNPVIEKLDGREITVVSPFDDTSGIGEQLSLLNEVIEDGLD